MTLAKLIGPNALGFLLNRHLRALTVVTAMGLGSGCGPIAYMNQVTRRAASEVAAAREVGAERYAPYEYTSAVVSLHKAREEAGYSDYQAAIRLGERAELMARRAKEVALRAAARIAAEEPDVEDPQ